MNDFAGKVALVAGSSGIGRATALRLAAGGARVMVIGIDEAANKGLAEDAPELAVQRADVTVADDVSAAVAETIKRFGGLDIIVNSAAVHPYGDAVTTTPETFLRCLAVNVGGIHMTAHFGIPEMKKRGGGAIVNIASVQGHACQNDVEAYASSKGAIHALTRAMALDFAADKIRVNSVSPGSVRTPLLEIAAHKSDGPDADVDAVFARFGAAHPIGRIGEPEEIAELAAFLASDKAGFVTGSDYRIDGGLTAGLGVR
jgi:NAD(P)-dependent dehydrogenase (short-subunit alcohol dehydrogenase family)